MKYNNIILLLNFSFVDYDIYYLILCYIDFIQRESKKSSDFDLIKSFE